MEIVIKPELQRKIEKAVDLRGYVTNAGGKKGAYRKGFRLQLKDGAKKVNYPAGHASSLNLGFIYGFSSRKQGNEFFAELKAGRAAASTFGAGVKPTDDWVSSTGRRKRSNGGILGKPERELVKQFIDWYGSEADVEKTLNGGKIDIWFEAESFHVEAKNGSGRGAVAETLGQLESYGDDFLEAGVERKQAAGLFKARPSDREIAKLTLRGYGVFWRTAEGTFEEVWPL